MGESIPLKRTTVRVAGDAVYVNDFEEHDRIVVSVVGEAVDPSMALSQCLQVGARAIYAAEGGLDGELIEKRFDAMSGRFDQQVCDAVEKIAESADRLLDEEDGALPATLAAHRAQMEALLGETFDPESKKSVLAAFEKVLADAHREQIESVRRLISLDGEDSPLVKMKREIVHDVGAKLNDTLGDIRTEVKDMSEKIAVNAAVAPVIEITSAKGFRFEDVVHAHVTALTAAHGDMAEQVGTLTGASKGQAGDELVTLNPEDTRGVDGRIAIEVKAKNMSMRATQLELDAALTNREAQAAIAVFRSQDQAPTSLPFQYFERKAIVVLDDETDQSALRLAYMWARWVVRRSLTASESGLDHERLGALMDDATRAVGRVSTIRRYHTQARRSIELAGDEVSDLKRETENALEALRAELEDGGDHGNHHG